MTVLGNPVVGSALTVEIQGAEGQQLMLRVVDERGYWVSKAAIPAASARERVTLPVDRGAGMYLLRVSTPTQHQTVKVLKAD